MTYSPFLARKIQERLQQLGFYQGEVDGKIGVITQQAIWSALDRLTPDTIKKAVTKAQDGLTAKGEQKALRAVHTLVWHCTATPEGKEFSLDSIDRMHKARGFSGIGYHKLIHLDGSVDEGRSESVIGAHVAGHNTGTLGYSYVGGLTLDGKAKDTRTGQQKATMLQLTNAAVIKYKLKQVVGHRDLSPDKDRDGVVEPHEWTKICPCFDTRKEYSHLLK